jgi:mono/diheme cytochrome c family protein
VAPSPSSAIAVKRPLFNAFITALTAGVIAAQAADDKVKTGARLYQDNCESCHGEDLHNNSGVTFDLRRLRADEHDRFVNSVLNGKNAMPAWRGALDTREIEQLWGYIRANAYDAAAN